MRLFHTDLSAEVCRPPGLQTLRQCLRTSDRHSNTSGYVDHRSDPKAVHRGRLSYPTLLANINAENLASRGRSQHHVGLTRTAHFQDFTARPDVVDGV